MKVEVKHINKLINLILFLCKLLLTKLSYSKQKASTKYEIIRDINSI